jgi:hypothetical protein
MSARFLMIALDGADGALLDRWSADGTLPNLAALRAAGAVTHLSAPAGDGVTTMQDLGQMAARALDVAM